MKNATLKIDNEKPVEVFRVLPEYQTVSKERKLCILDLLEGWIKDERKKLEKI